MVSIDTFDAQSLVVDGTFPGGSPSAQVSGASIIGGSRSIQAVNHDGELFGTIVSTNNDAAKSGFFSVSNSSGTSGTGILTWDGGTDGNPLSVDTFGLGGVDLVLGSNDAFAFDIISIDQPFTLTLQVWDDVSSVSVTKTLTTADKGTTNYTLFSEFAGINFLKIGAIQMTLVGSNDADITMNDFVSTVVPPSPVPLPASIPLLLMGVAALGVMRNKRSS
ncbi:hypothetical protein P775_09490 [Puniceibacterium antarcticum]|uniref:PEP-CTERM protein-sorting domain-containing protein n=1 Tax=Puniceibacterium antarcticum TaxID=1206336 RepID=A0A2G8RFV3_9RHOB|nr:hypothetical protein P775_09490 [Puniceibacterium antarcticum]